VPIGKKLFADLAGYACRRNFGPDERVVTDEGLVRERSQENA
jgi:hypothetical protein